MNKDNNIASHSVSFIHEIKQIVTEAWQKACADINSAMVKAYWQMGKRIGERRAAGKRNIE